MQSGLMIRSSKVKIITPKPFQGEKCSSPEFPTELRDTEGEQVGSLHSSHASSSEPLPWSKLQVLSFIFQPRKVSYICVRCIGSQGPAEEGNRVCNCKPLIYLLQPLLCHRITCTI